MKTLKIIQTVYKIGKILSKIMFIICIVGFCGGAVGILSLAVGAETIKIGGVTIKSILKTEANVSAETVYCAMVIAMILCAGEAVVAKFAEHYFAREQKDGTPFNFGGAKELLRLGILEICIPFGTYVISGIVYAVFKAAFSDIMPLDLNYAGSLGLGVMLIIVSLLCKLGAENAENAGNARNAISAESAEK